MYWDFILRIFIAGILGGVIGLEREYRSKEAGFRTHLLVALGSALFMILSHSGFGEILARGDTNISLDPSRIASQVVTGIGFIGYGSYRYDVRFGNVSDCRIGYRYGIGVLGDTLSDTS